MTPQARSGHLAMLCFSVLVAGSFALGVLAANDITPLALNAVRFWIASAIIGFLVALRGGVPWAALTAPWRYLVLASALTFAIGAALPLVLVVLAPPALFDVVVAGGSLVTLAMLGALAAKAGGAALWQGTLRVTLWGAVAMAATMGIGALFGTTLA